MDGCRAAGSRSAEICRQNIDNANYQKSGNPAEIRPGDSQRTAGKILEKRRQTEGIYLIKK